MAQPWGRGHGEVQPLPVHDTRPAALTVSILPAWSLEVEMEIYFNDSLKPNCIQAARERERILPHVAVLQLGGLSKASLKPQGRQTVSFQLSQTAEPGAGSNSVALRSKNQPRTLSVLFVYCHAP